MLKDSWDELKDIFWIICYMAWGFADGGKSFEDGLEMIDEQYGLL
jgi:hypothetical protein